MAFLLAIHLVVKRKCKVFQIQIVSGLLLQYLLNTAVDVMLIRSSSLDLAPVAYFLIVAILNGTHFSTHWLFVSQYLKTCILLPRFIRKKWLLQKIFEEKENNENQIRGLSEHFLEQQKEFDFLVSSEKQKIRWIKKTFIAVDSAILTILISYEVYQSYQMT